MGSCARCGGKAISRIRKRNQFDCDSCRYQFSVTAGTFFHESHLPLWKWFLAVYLTCESKKDISSKQLQRTLGVSYKTAWYLAHRIRAAMRRRGIAAPSPSTCAATPTVPTTTPVTATVQQRWSHQRGVELPFREPERL
jgi:transposase-like protein